MSRHLRHRGDHRPGSEQERGSILIVLAFIIFTALILTVVAEDAVAQLGLGSSLARRDNALQAATAGVQSAVAEIRGATTKPSGSTGVITSLPCTGPTGTVPGSDGGASYTTSVSYVLRSTTGGSPESVNCLSSGLPTGYILDTASIASTGTAGSVQRAVHSTYTFTTTYTPIPGGQILSYDNLDCLWAPIPNSNPGTGPYPLEVTTSCSAPAIPQETFVYNRNWTLQVTVGGTAWCIQNPWETSPSPSSSAPAAQLVPCATTTGSAPNAQEWGINNSAPIQGVQPNGHEDSYCLSNPIASGTKSSSPEAVTVQSCNGNFNQAQTWQMAQTVGAGDAAPVGGNFFGPTEQMVNFQQFGRCLDVNGQDVGNNSLIVYPCKQFPDPNQEPIWNQRWCWAPVPGAASPSPNASVGILYTPNPPAANNSAKTCLSTYPDTIGGDNALAQGGVTTSASGPLGGGAVGLDGSTSGYLQTSDQVNGPQTFTEMAWFETTGSGSVISFANVQGTSSISSWDRMIWVDPKGHVVAGVYNGSTAELKSPGTYNDGSWHLAELTLSPAGFRLYVDGVLQASKTSVTSAQGYSGYWHIGWSNAGQGWPDAPSSAYLPGSVAGAAIFDTALSGSQSLGLYQQPSFSAYESQVATDGATSSWPLQQPSASGTGSWPVPTSVIPECLVPEGYSYNSGTPTTVDNPFVTPCGLSSWPPTSSDLAQLESQDMVWVQWNQQAPSNVSYAYSVYSGDNAGFQGTAGTPLDDVGWCLDAGALGTTAGGGDQYSFAQMAKCNGAWTEKWNAPPSYGVQPLTDTYEPLLTAGG